MKILLTGGAGFIGSHVCEELLLHHASTEVVVLDNFFTGRRENVPSQFRICEMDMRSSQLLPFLQKEKFDSIIHLAAQTMVPASIEDPLFDADLNIMGLLNVLEGARKTGVKSIVFSSSAAVYGDNTNLPLRETEIPRPGSFYGLTKATTESYLKLYHELYGLHTTVLRFANVYGERQGLTGEGGVISIFAKHLSQGLPLTVFGDGTQTRDFVYVKDIAKALCLAVAHEGFGIFNVSTGQEISLNKLISIFHNIFKVEPRVNYEKVRPGDIYRSVLSNKAIGEGLGLTAFTSLEDGLARTSIYFQKNNL